MSTYEEAAAGLPRPTTAQAEEFARFVSRHHSWYKHLPMDPPVPFLFFLDPEAGRRFVRTDSGDVAFVDYTQETRDHHGGHVTTEQYREQFGYWSYFAPYGSSFRFAGEGGTIDTAGPGLRILTTFGEWLEIPPPLLEAGTAELTALVHPDRNDMIWFHRAPSGGLLTVLRRLVNRLPAPVWEEVEEAANRVEQTGFNPILNVVTLSRIRPGILPYLDRYHEEVRECELDGMSKAMGRFLTRLDG